QLDRALQYAESAVTDASTKLRNTEIDRLTVNDLENVSALSAYWDTLGWVYFQKGDIDNSERYIAAAWRLSEHGEVGYHLGQILEKRGKNLDAMRVYAEATVAMRSVPEASESLERLAGKDKKTTLLQEAKARSADSRTINVGAGTVNVKDTTEARFFVVLVPGSA